MAALDLWNVAHSISAQIRSLFSQEIRLVLGVKAELQKLRTAVSAIITSGLLREFEDRRFEAESVKDWFVKLGDALHDADRLLDDIRTEVFRRRVMGGDKRILNEVRIFFSSSNQLLYAIKMAHRVKEVRERIDATWHDRFLFQLEGNSNLIGSLVENRVMRETYPYDPQPYVIGRDKDKNEVIEFLLTDFDENVTVLPIVGIGGLGKTTLARLVFNDMCVKQHFELKLWVCISANFDVQNILRKILRECIASEELNANLDMHELQKKVGEKLDGKKFLLVLDDAWNENPREWLKLHGLLQNGAKGSKILVTTRTPRVARTMTDALHELSGLSEEESLSLLKRITRKEALEWRNQNLEMVAKEILKKCAGVPLAIMTIGRLLLFSRNAKEDWPKFKNIDLWRINQEEGDIMPSLKMSYDFLPSHLKQCFAYCSVFPKDYELEPRELVHLWMAQGFIKHRGSSMNTIEEVGYNYFTELLSRSFFQDIEEDLYGNIVRCKMHVLMHELAQFVAGNVCITIDSSNAIKFQGGVRHVSIIATEDYEWNGFERDRTVRSLFLIAGKRISIGHLDFSYFRNLRALRLQDVVWDVTSQSIGELKHLRSLDLSKNDKLSYLPNSVSNLCNLERLNLRECHRLQELPRGITRLVNLRHLEVSGCSRLMHLPSGIEKLTSLQTLDMFVVGEKQNSHAARFNEMSRLTRLRKQLTIQHLERLESISGEVDAFFSMEKFVLQCLELHWDTNVVMANAGEVLERLRPRRNLEGLKIAGYGGPRLSSWISLLDKLVQIEIIDCHQCSHLPPLDQLPSLKRIYLSRLRDLEFIELSENSGTSQSFYPSLEEITLSSLHGFRGWKRRGNRIEEEDDDDDDSLLILHAFSDKVKFSIEDCPRFSYRHGQQLLQLGGTTSKI
ncbi:putative disease resistance protein RGA3 [Punica granatum]|uniref:Disease resistance protein RGA3 n=1 Tax=Punica granatum TaxID=22663 RepID=A0A218XPB7_PUNGR|nr:putative disease resistance protein RGA3 [Punica granatum]XP_031374878.1 putative disease resistance protein RGA3 [Punica granatum]XP_031374879.1 putative disease resistance protein RGA3 [Punica granatum]XP_031374880.1 putative disease resistance protein RGA3 [Punica granatum]OWM86803.1 hypothetical protein CDL15_Pgr015839 [Punica granatum]